MKNLLISLLAKISISFCISICLVYAYDDFIDFGNSQVINQREAVKAKCWEDISLITTTGVGPCLFVVLFDPEQKIGIAAHWDDETKKEEIEKFFKILENANSNFSDIEAYLIGGWDSKMFPYPKIIATYLEHALIANNITKINKDHLYEKMEFPETPTIDTDDFPKYMFFGLGFDVCTGSLKLFDIEPIQGLKGGEMPDLCKHNPLKEDIPYSGCPLKFLRSKKIKKDL